MRPHRIGLDTIYAELERARPDEDVRARATTTSCANLESRQRSACSRPATQRSVVVLPQPEGRAARRSRLPHGEADRQRSHGRRSQMIAQVGDFKRARSGPTISSICRSTAGNRKSCPNRHPGAAAHILVEIREPDLDHLGIDAFRKTAGTFIDCQVDPTRDHEGFWPSFDMHQFRTAWGAFGR